MKKSRLFLNQHKDADILIYDDATKVLISAVYFAPFYHDEKIKAEIFNLIKKHLKEEAQ